MKTTIFCNRVRKTAKGVLPFCLLILLPLFASCSDWLDVKPVGEEREKDMFDSYKGFKETLAGCYSALADRDIYGEKLMVSDIELLANLWAKPSEISRPAYYYMYAHDYNKDESITHISSIYGALFNVVAQANTIIENMEAKGHNITSEQARNVIEAEAHAIRALCQMDILRLFGQMPQGGSKKVSLPYAEKVSISELPSYYDFDGYVAKLKSDLDIAENLLSKSDPLLQYSYYELDGDQGYSNDLDDDFLTYRRERLNLWAVKALKARLFLYLGDQANAYKYAKEIINAQLNGKPVIELSGLIDLTEQTTTGAASQVFGVQPRECLFALYNSNLANYMVNVVGGDLSNRVDVDMDLYITTKMLNSQLYAGQNTTSNNRYLRFWEHTLSATSTELPTLKKYYYDVNASVSVDVLRTKLNVMPMIRLSEIYLIAMETTTDLAEANALYKEYMRCHNVNVDDAVFSSLEEVKNEVVNEYRREFYGEGVMFYTYKRLGTESILWGQGEMGEDQYILPLPSSEYNPNV